MKINPQDIKLPLQKTVSYRDGEVEVSLAAMSDHEGYLYKEYMSCCGNDDFAFVDTQGMGKEDVMKTCAVNWDKVKDVITEQSQSRELNTAQKKLPPVMQEAIKKKIGLLASEEKAEAKSNKKPVGLPEDLGNAPVENDKPTVAKKMKAKKEGSKDEEAGESPTEEAGEDENVENANAKKDKSAKKHADEENPKEQKGETSEDEKLEDVKASGQRTKLLSKNDQVPTMPPVNKLNVNGPPSSASSCPACAQLNDAKDAGAEKQVCGTCKK